MKEKDKCIFCIPPMEPYTKLAHAYVPFQTMDKVFSPGEALKKGTLFPELHVPYKYEVYCK